MFKNIYIWSELKVGSSSVILFVDSKPIELTATVYEHSIIIKGIEYAFTGLSRYLKGNVLFLNLKNGLLLPLIPAPVQISGTEYYKQTATEIKQKTEELKELIASVKSKKITEDQLAKIKQLITEYIPEAIEAKDIETVFLSKEMIPVKNVKIDGKSVDAIWDAGASVNVLKEHPKNYRTIGSVMVRSYKSIGRQPKFTATIEIKGKKITIDYILDTQLPYDALLSTATMNHVAKQYDFKTGEVIYE